MEFLRLILNGAFGKYPFFQVSKLTLLQSMFSIGKWDFLPPLPRKKIRLELI